MEGWLDRMSKSGVLHRWQRRYFKARCGRVIGTTPVTRAHLRANSSLSRYFCLLSDPTETVSCSTTRRGRMLGLPALFVCAAARFASPATVGWKFLTKPSRLYQRRHTRSPPQPRTHISNELSSGSHACRPRRCCGQVRRLSWRLGRSPWMVRLQWWQLRIRWYVRLCVDGQQCTEGRVGVRGVISLHRRATHGRPTRGPWCPTPAPRSFWTLARALCGAASPWAQPAGPVSLRPRLSRPRASAAWMH